MSENQLKHKRKIRRTVEHEQKKNKREFVRYEYKSKYSAVIPKAPAFTTVSSQKVKEIVNRLSAPRKLTRREESEPKHNRKGKDESLTILRINQPTVASYIRHEMRAGKDRKLHVGEISSACYKHNQQTLQNKLTAKFKNWINLAESKSNETEFSDDSDD